MGGKPGKRPLAHRRRPLTISSSGAPARPIPRSPRAVPSVGFVFSAIVIVG